MCFSFFKINGWYSSDCRRRLTFRLIPAALHISLLCILPLRLTNKPTSWKSVRHLIYFFYIHPEQGPLLHGIFIYFLHSIWSQWTQSGPVGASSTIMTERTKKEVQLTETHTSTDRASEKMKTRHRRDREKRVRLTHTHTHTAGGSQGKKWQRQYEDIQDERRENCEK